MSDHFVGGATCALPAAEDSALIDGLVDATEGVVFVVALAFAVAVEGAGLVGVTVNHSHDWLLDDDSLLDLLVFKVSNTAVVPYILSVVDFVDNSALLEPLVSDPIHLLLGDWLSSNLLSCINGHKPFTLNSLVVVSGDKLSIGNVSVFFLN